MGDTSRVRGNRTKGRLVEQKFPEKLFQIFPMPIIGIVGVTADTKYW